MRLPIAIIIAAIIPLTGCQSLQDGWRDGRIQKGLLIGARKVGLYVGGQVLQLAISGKDFTNRKDYLQGLTEALWSNSGQLLDPSTVQEIAEAWTPNNDHWKELAERLSKDFTAKMEEIAKTREPTKEDVTAILNGYAQGIFAATNKTPAQLEREKLIADYVKDLEAVAVMKKDDPQGYQEVKAIIDAGYAIRFEEIKTP